jgi:hypothetical protein
MPLHIFVSLHMAHSLIEGLPWAGQSNPLCVSMHLPLRIDCMTCVLSPEVISDKQ